MTSIHSHQSIRGLIVGGCLTMLGCSSSMNDTSGTETSGGIAQARQGLQLVRNDASGISGSSVDAGGSDSDRGIGMMADGTGRIESGMNMMSGGMMSGCCRGTDEVVAPMKEAIARVRSGRDKLTDGDVSNDSDGATEMQDGCDAMSDALDNAEKAMSCMGHGSMSSMM